jgi:hypothetical protein
MLIYMQQWMVLVRKRGSEMLNVAVADVRRLYAWARNEQERSPTPMH